MTLKTYKLWHLTCNT